MLRGISAVGVGLIAATGFKMLKEELSYRPMLIVIALSIVMAHCISFSTWLGGCYHPSLGTAVCVE
jgi:hypothetical protein